MGDTTNVASRLQSLAEPGSVLISGDTQRLVKGVFEFSARGAVELRGRTEAVPIYEVTGYRAAVVSARGVEGLASVFVGRGAEIGVLCDLVSSLKRGHGQCIALTGEAGLGKSRLVAEFHSEAQQVATLNWLEGRTLSYGVAVSYHPWRQIIRGSIGVTELDPIELIRSKLKARVQALGLSDEIEAFLEVLVDAESEVTTNLLDSLEDPVQDRIANAMRAYLLALANEGPTVVVLDDLHWADEGSIRLLDAVSDAVTGIYS